MNEYWKSKLTPWDAELFMMVESLTGKPCVPKNGGDHYFIEPDYIDHANEPEYLLAIWDAIEGRAGNRLISIEDQPDRHRFFVRIKFGESKFPGIVRLGDEHEARPDCGSIFCHKLEEIRAVRVRPGNEAQLLEFVGNGELEMPEDEPCVFYFRNAGMNVYASAPEGSYIVYVGPQRFEVVDRDTFEREYEPK